MASRDIVITSWPAQDRDGDAGFTLQLRSYWSCKERLEFLDFGGLIAYLYAVHTIWFARGVTSHVDYNLVYFNLPTKWTVNFKMDYHKWFKGIEFLKEDPKDSELIQNTS